MDTARIFIPNFVKCLTVDTGRGNKGEAGGLDRNSLFRNIAVYVKGNVIRLPNFTGQHIVNVLLTRLTLIRQTGNKCKIALIHRKNAPSSNDTLFYHTGREKAIVFGINYQ